ncbi:MAG: hypothetical protein Q9201_004434 [Fulgogasparrea decipioides]
MADDTELFLSPEYAVAVWAQRLRYSGLLISRRMVFAGLGLPSFAGGTKGFERAAPAALLQRVSSLAGNATEGPSLSEIYVVPYTAMELLLAKSVYWIIGPLFQYIAAMVLADTFQYFTHRAFHVNKWLYKHIHSMHHDIYVPFAYGAFYNHPLETIPIDGIGFPYCLYLAGLDNRQAAFFGAIWTFKTVVDHCGYDFPYNPCNIVCPNSVLFHDLHHQTWGMKYNFSVYGAFWDWIMGTRWSPHNSKAQEKYRKGKATAEAAAARARSRDQTSKPAGEIVGKSIVVRM